jgi:RNA polymerase sigma-70 factor (ECF subfamily)
LRFLVTKVRNDQEAEDLLHDTFIALRTVRPPTHDTGFRLGTFVLGVARNIFLNHLRARGRRSRRELDFGEVRLCELDAGLSSIVCAGQQAHALLEALREIPVEDQMLLELKYFEDLSGDEIAAVLAVNTTAMPGRTARAKQRLQERLAVRLRLGQGDVRADKVERWAGEALAEIRRQRRELWA